MQRGINALQIETQCYWTKPKQDWKLSTDGKNTTFNKFVPQGFSLRDNLLRWKAKKPLKKVVGTSGCRKGGYKERWGTTKRNKSLKAVQVPAELFWGDINGKN